MTIEQQGKWFIYDHLNFVKSNKMKTRSCVKGLKVD